MMEEEQFINIKFKDFGSADAQIEVTATVTPNQVWAIAKQLEFLANQTATENRMRRLMEMEAQAQQSRNKIMTPDMIKEKML